MVKNYGHIAFLTGTQKTVFKDTLHPPGVNSNFTVLGSNENVKTFLDANSVCRTRSDI